MHSNSEYSTARKKIQNYSYFTNSSIGKGYSSQVFQGKNDLTNETVAIKVIDMKNIKGEVHKNLLISQMEVLKNLKNTENIIEVYDIYTTKNNTYIITELCDQGDLAKLITTKKTFSESEALDLMTQIINGYNHIFSRGIIHRDLKPANIFLRQNEIKIADFGFAMKLSDSKKYSSYNVGSPIYMPPQALNDNKYSFKSDIWALGVIFFEMLTGKTPWRAKTQKQLGKQLLSVPIEQLLPKNISCASADFLKRTLNTDINNRMSPEQLSRFSFFLQKFDKQSTRSDLISSNSIEDTKNYLLKSGEKIETSLTRNAINTPKNFKRSNFFKNTCKQMKELKEIKNTSLPKPTNQPPKSEHLISPKSNQNFNPAMTFTATQKQLSNFRSTNNITIIDKKMLSKHLLTQIHLCRFLYKLLMRIHNKLSEQLNAVFTEMKKSIAGLVFQRLQKIEKLQLLTSIEKKEYMGTSDYAKITQIVNQYQTKYHQDLSSIEAHHHHVSIEELRETINYQIILLFGQVENQNPTSVKEEVIVLDYLITLRQLLCILAEDNIQTFHNKSKMEQIVEGSPSQNISREHIEAIKAKLKTLKML